MDETSSPGRGPQNRHRRRTPKTNNGQPESLPSQSSQPSRTRGRGGGQNNNNNRNRNQNQTHNQNQNHNHNRNREQRSTTPEAISIEAALASVNITTPKHKGSPDMRQAQVSEIKFAGVFTNSPAASALPIPSFCVKPAAVPQSPTPRGNDPQESQDSLDDSEDGTQSSSDADTHESDPSPASPLSTPAHVSVNLFGSRNDESPLDRIFRADREEKQRALQQGINSVSPRKAPEPLGFSPVQLHREARVRNALSQTSPRMPNNTPPSLYGGISPQELDGTPGRVIGPAFSTPYHQRMSQARQTPTTPATPPQSTAQSLSAASDSTDRSEALKRYLFGGAKKAVDDSPKPQPVMQTPTKSPFESIYAGAQSPRSPDLVLMEDNLRRILNLSPAQQIHEQPATIYS